MVIKDLASLSLTWQWIMQEALLEYSLNLIQYFLRKWTNRIDLSCNRMYTRCSQTQKVTAWIMALSDSMTFLLQCHGVLCHFTKTNNIILIVIEKFSESMIFVTCMCKEIVLSSSCQLYSCYSVMQNVITDEPLQRFL